MGSAQLTILKSHSGLLHGNLPPGKGRLSSSASSPKSSSSSGHRPSSLFNNNSESGLGILSRCVLDEEVVRSRCAGRPEGVEPVMGEVVVLGPELGNDWSNKS